MNDDGNNNNNNNNNNEYWQSPKFALIRSVTTLVDILWETNRTENFQYPGSISINMWKFISCFGLIQCFGLSFYSIQNI